MKLTMLGAAKQVTGSMMLLETKTLKIIIDCGLVQTNDFIKDMEENKKIPKINLKNVDYLILTHAHSDHAGKIPFLVKNGFNGPIITTEPTMNICDISLKDCAFIWQREIQKINSGKSKKYIKYKNKIEAPYEVKDVEKALKNFRGYGYNKEIILNKEVSLIFRPTGHIMGAASVEINVKEEITTKLGKEYKNKKIVFSGDISGKKDFHPFIKPVEYIDKADYLIMESTYGDRNQKRSNPEDVLAKAIQETCIERKKTVLIASFSIQRLQELIWYLYNVYQKNPQFNNILIHIDTPMGTKVTLDVYSKMKEFYNQYALDLKDKIGDIFLNWGNLQYVATPTQSKALANGAPKIIIASAGMMQAGRIVHHVSSFLPSKGCSVILTGYCAAGTFGRKLLEAKEFSKSYVKGLDGKDIDIKAKVIKIDGMSGHADKQNLVNFASNINGVKKIILNHGDKDAIFSLKNELQKNIDVPILVPVKNQIITLP